MPPKNDSPTKPPSTDKPKGAAAKRAKPSFELPSDASSSKTAQGWVYRESEEKRAHVVVVESQIHEDAKPEPEGSDAAPPHVFSSMAGVVVLSCTAAALTTFALIRWFSLPIAAATSIIPGRPE